MKLRKIVATLATIIVAVSMFAGCSKTPSNDSNSSNSNGDNGPSYLNLTGMPLVKESKTLKIMVNNSARQPDFGEVAMWKAYEKMTGVDIEWQNIPAGTANEKMSMAFVSGELPDAFLKFTMSNSNQLQYGNDDMLLNLKEGDMLKTYAPNFYKYMKENPTVESALTFPDGSMYSFPQAIESIPNKVAGKMFFNKTWLDKVGKTLPKTTEDVYEILKAFKTQDPNGNGKPDEIPFSSPNFNYVQYGFEGAFGCGNRGVHDTLVDADPKTGKARITAASNEWKQMLEFCKKLYDEKLLDNEIFTMKDAQFTAKAAEDKIGMFVYTNLSNIPDNLGKNFVGIEEAIEGPNGSKFWYPVRSDLHSTGAFVITSACKTPELALRFVDYFYSDEGSLLYNYGVEGETHIVKDGKYDFVDSVYNSMKDGNITFDSAVAPHVTCGGNNPIIVKEKYFYGGESKSVPSAAAHAMKKYFPEEIWPMFTFTKEENDEMSVIRTDISNYVNKMRAEFVTGKTSLNEWDNYIKQIEKMNSKKLCEIIDAAYARNKK